jgi:gluconate:H+ symporter, GntP family
VTGADARLVLSALAGIGVAVGLIVRGRLHPFIGLLCGAFTVGALAGLPMTDTAGAAQKGVADILGSTGLVVALGLSLGAMLQLSNGAASIAKSGLSLVGATGAPWASLIVAMVVGLPLFFETGLVLLLPIMGAAASISSTDHRDTARLRLMLSALAGLSVVHALVPPHPGPLLAVAALGANLGRTIAYGIIVAVPTALIAGPLLSRFQTRGITLVPPEPESAETLAGSPDNRRTLLVILLPVLVIASGQLHQLLPTGGGAGAAWLAAFSNPVLALLITNLCALPLLFGRRAGEARVQERIWTETMKPAGGILLAIGAGGALKQVLVTAGLSDLLARFATAGSLSPIVLAWLVAVGIRLATGSATVATITTAGIMSGVVAATGAPREWVVLAIGAGSVFFSHVNDPGFWLVRSYLGTSTEDTFKTWSILETVISVVGLASVLVASYLL